ncbi:MAG: LptF/LptG family permease [Planctomycetes bacterium]|nr:LptF/LptG family permease [Planctomycetota bacterium]
MLKKLDRYVLKQFILTLSVTALVLLGLYLIVHFFTKIQDFIEISHKNIFLFIVKYYFYRLPMIILDLIPLITLVAAMVTITLFIKTNELTPMFSAGLSIYRILVPIFVFAFFISVFMFFLDEKIVPTLKADISQTEKILKSEGQERYILTHDENNSTVLIQSYDYTEKMMRKVSITECGEGNTLQSKLIAETARWINNEKDTAPGRWQLYHGTAYFYDQSGRRKGPPRKFAEDGYAWTTDLTPTDLARTDDTLSYTELSRLKKMILKYPHQNYLKVKFYSKMALPLVNLILLFLGLPFVLIGESKNFFAGVGICLVVCIIFFMFQFFFESLGTKGLVNPIVAVWFPLVFFGGVAVFLFQKVRT